MDGRRPTRTSATRSRAGARLDVAYANRVAHTQIGIRPRPAAQPGLLIGRERALEISSPLELVAAQVEKTPLRPALGDGRREVTYRDAWSLVEVVAERIRACGGGPGTTVALCGWRSIELVIGLLGILRARAAYVPLDTSYPPQRVAFMLDDSGAELIVGHTSAIARFGSDGRELLPLDDLVKSEVSRPRSRSLDFPSADDLCYVMYTSGSTGTPKGVMMEHRGLANLVQWQVADSPPESPARTLQFSPVSFDVSFQEIFSTLGAGGTLVCVPEQHRLDPYLLWKFLADQRITRLFLPFVALQSLALFAKSLPERTLRLREVITAGEQLHCSGSIRRLFELLPSCSLVNQYGPAETHVVTRERLEGAPREWPALPPIGSPIDNVRLYALREDGSPVPVPGGSAELGVAGVAVGRGYCGGSDPERRFVREPGEPGDARMYRTGDLVEVDEPGKLRFLGRADDQVKIRGHRVELGEVETELMRHAGVDHAAVVVEGSDATEKKLVAVVTGRLSAADLADVRSFAGERLPAHMVPARIEVVAELPRTPSGKIDRRALAARARASSRKEPQPSAPTSLADRVLAAVETVVGRKVGADNFVEIGGDSLAAARLAGALSDELSRTVPISAILSSSSLDHLVRQIRGQPPESRTPRSKRSHENIPVSGVQRQLLLDDEVHAGGSQHLVAAELAIRGPLDVDTLRAALNDVVSRHGALRTRYWFDGTDFRQEVARQVRVDIRQSGHDVDLARESALAERIDLAEPAVPRATLVRLPDEQRLLIVAHHICCDGWSLNILLHELLELYAARVERRAPALTEPPQFADVARLGDRADLSELEYWRSALEGTHEVSFPPDRATTGRRRPHIQRLSFALGHRVTAKVRTTALGEHVTPFSLLLAAWAGVLGDATRVSEVPIAVPMAGRESGESFCAIGPFANTVVVRVPIAVGRTGSDAMRAVHETLLDAHDHQHTSFADVVRAVAPRRDPRRQPLARVMIAMHPRTLRTFSLPLGAQATLSLDLDVPESTRFDVVLGLVDFEDEITGSLDYDASRYRRETVARIRDLTTARIAALASDPLARRPCAPSQHLG